MTYLPHPTPSIPFTGRLDWTNSLFQNLDVTARNVPLNLFGTPIQPHQYQQFTNASENILASVNEALAKTAPVLVSHTPTIPSPIHTSFTPGVHTPAYPPDIFNYQGIKSMPHPLDRVDIQRPVANPVQQEYPFSGDTFSFSKSPDIIPEAAKGSPDKKAHFWSNWFKPRPKI